MLSKKHLCYTTNSITNTITRHISTVKFSDLAIKDNLEITFQMKQHRNKMHKSDFGKS